MARPYNSNLHVRVYKIRNNEFRDACRDRDHTPAKLIRQMMADYVAGNIVYSPGEPLCLK